MKRRFAILTIIVVAALCGIFRVSQVKVGLEQRRTVESWTRSIDHYDRNQTQSQNDKGRITALRLLGPVAIKILSEDLQYNPPQRGWLRHGPEWVQAMFVPKGDWRQEWRPEEVRRQAAFHLADMGPQSEPALSDLLRAASDNDAGVRDAVAIALGSLGRSSPEILRALKTILNRAPARLKFSPAFSLWRLQPNDAAASDRLARLITARNLSWASLCFWRVGELGEDFAPAFRKAMADSASNFAKVQAAKSLWLMTRDTEPAQLALHAIRRELNDSSAQRITGAGAAPWKRAEYDLSSAALVLDDIPECRELIKLLLERVRNDDQSEAREMASDHLTRIEKLELETSPPLSGESTR